MSIYGKATKKRTNLLLLQNYKYHFLIQQKSNSEKNKKRAIHAAILKYGWENFTREEIYCSKDQLHALEMEDKFIDIYNAMAPNGYNLIRDGQKGTPKEFKRKTPMSDEQKKRMSFIKSNPSDETRKNLSVAMKKRFSDPIKKAEFIRVTHTPEAKAKQIASLKCRYKNEPEFLEARKKVQREILSRPEVIEKLRIAGTNSQIQSLEQ